MNGFLISQAEAYFTVRIQWIYYKIDWVLYFHKLILQTELSTLTTKLNGFKFSLTKAYFEVRIQQNYYKIEWVLNFSNRSIFCSQNSANLLQNQMGFEFTYYKLFLHTEFSTVTSKLSEQCQNTFVISTYLKNSIDFSKLWPSIIDINQNAGRPRGFWLRQAHYLVKKVKCLKIEVQPNFLQQKNSVQYILVQYLSIVCSCFT